MRWAELSISFHSPDSAGADRVFSRASQSHANSWCAADISKQAGGPAILGHSQIDSSIAVEIAPSATPPVAVNGNSTFLRRHAFECAISDSAQKNSATLDAPRSIVVQRRKI